MFAKHVLAILLSGSLVLATAPAGFADQTSQPTNQPTPTNAKQTPEQVQQLVAPLPANEDFTRKLVSLFHLRGAVQVQSTRLSPFSSWFIVCGEKRASSRQSLRRTQQYSRCYRRR